MRSTPLGDVGKRIHLACGSYIAAFGLGEADGDIVVVDQSNY